MDSAPMAPSYCNIVIFQINEISVTNGLAICYNPSGTYIAFLGERTMQRVKILLVFSVLALTVSKPAWAYLDPGTGMILLQGLIATVAGGFALIGIYWRKLKSVLGFRDQTPPPTDSGLDRRDS
jgi:hypothetical protein